METDIDPVKMKEVLFYTNWASGFTCLLTACKIPNIFVLDVLQNGKEKNLLFLCLEDMGNNFSLKEQSLYECKEADK